MYIFATHLQKCWIVHDLEQGKQQYTEQDTTFIMVENEPIEITNRNHVYILNINDVNEVWILEYNICNANGSGESTYIEYYTNIHIALSVIEDMFHDVTRKTKQKEITKLRNQLIKHGQYTIPFRLLNDDHSMQDYTFRLYSL